MAPPTRFCKGCQRELPATAFDRAQKNLRRRCRECLLVQPVIDPTAPLDKRLWSRVKRGDPDACWLWLGSRRHNGYGRIIHKKKHLLVHRVAYELTFGPIPEGLQIDHVKARGCTNRHCVNPAHLEAVPNRINVLRGDSPPARQHRSDTCARGHDKAVFGSLDRLGKQRCNACRRLSVQRCNARMRTDPASRRTLTETLVDATQRLYSFEKE